MTVLNINCHPGAWWQEKTKTKTNDPQNKIKTKQNKKEQNKTKQNKTKKKRTCQ